MCTNSARTDNTEAVSTRLNITVLKGDAACVNVSAVVQREQRPGGLGGSDLVNKGGGSGGVGEDEGFRSEQGKA